MLKIAGTQDVIHFPKPEMCVMWNHEFTGQMSDGVYENDPVTDTDLGKKWWWTRAEVGDPKNNGNDCPYVLKRIVSELEKYRIDRYVSYCILITERPELFDHFSVNDERLIEQVANSVWHNGIVDDYFKGCFKQCISYITFEELKALFEKWPYEKAWCFTQDLVNEMDTYIH